LKSPPDGPLKGLFVGHLRGLFEGPLKSFHDKPLQGLFGGHLPGLCAVACKAAAATPRDRPSDCPRAPPGDVAEKPQSRGRQPSDRPRDRRETAVKATVTEGPSRDRQRNCSKELSKGTVQGTVRASRGAVSRRRFEWPERGAVSRSRLEALSRGAVSSVRFQGPFRGTVSRGRRFEWPSKGAVARSRLDGPSQGTVSRGCFEGLEAGDRSMDAFGLPETRRVGFAGFARFRRPVDPRVWPLPGPEPDPRRRVWSRRQTRDPRVRHKLKSRPDPNTLSLHGSLVTETSSQKTRLRDLATEDLVTCQGPCHRDRAMH
jgi:hypothetical protein